jgi:cytochrome c-type biogenesis protein CcmH
MNRKKLLSSGLLVLLLLFLTSSLVYAQSGTPHEPTDDEVNAIAKQMYCPVCENTPLDVCPTQACAEWRELIRDKLAEGWTEAEIKTYFVEQFGDRVLAEPPARGLNWLIYVIPPIAFVAGVYILYRAFRMMRVDAPVTIEEPQNAPEDRSEDDYVDRLEEELRKL